MNIKHRINARKIALSYFYQNCFFHFMQKGLQKTESESRSEVATETSTQNVWGFFDREFMDQLLKTREAQEHVDEYVKAKITEYAGDLDIESDFEYFLSYFFDQWEAWEVDVEYVLKVGAGLPRYRLELIEKVNQYTQSFKYDQMDVLDQACLLLGYVEYKVIETPKELVINEMVELCNRYSDSGSPKLINGLLHQIFLAEENK